MCHDITVTKLTFPSTDKSLIGLRSPLAQPIKAPEDTECAYMFRVDIKYQECV